MFDIMFFQVTPNKKTSHTSDKVNTLIKKVFTSNAVSSGCIYQINSSPTLNHSIYIWNHQ